MPISVPNIVTVVQARISSTRLPGKVILPLVGEPLLVRLMERIQAAKRVGRVVVATTTGPDDDPIHNLCLARDYLCYRGHPVDLLDRHYQIGKTFKADAVIKIPSDCPLLDPKIIDKVINAYLENPGAYDYVSNLHPPSYPDGNDVEVISFPALETIWRESRRDFEREHTTPALWENPDRFRLRNITWETGLDYSMTHRWTIDYQEDYEFIKAVYEALYPKNPWFGVEEILSLLAQRTDLAKINHKYAGVNWYRHHLDQLKTIGPEATSLTLEN